MFRITFLAPREPAPKYPRLYPIEPCGLGTGLVEAQTGYMTRLAEMHSLASGRFVNQVIIPASPEGLESDHHLGNRFAYLANGYGVVADRVSQALSTLVSHKWDLTQLSFLGLRGIFDPRGHGLLRDKFRWCPACWRDDAESNMTPYLRLVWCSRAVDVCIMHACFLEQACPHCGAHQNALPKLPFIYVCQSCGKDLHDISACRSAPPSENERMYWDARSIVRLIERLGSKGHHLSANIIPAKLKQIVDTQYAGDSVKFGDRIGLSRQLVRNWVTKETTPIITPFLDLCYRLSIPLDSFLLDSFDLTASSDWKVLGKQRYLRRNAVPPHRLEQISLEIDRFIQANSEVAPTVTKFAHELGVTTPFLRSHFPDEYMLIQHRSSEFQKDLRGRLRRERSRNLKKSVEELLARGQTISQRHIKKLGYMKPSDFRRPEIKKQIEWLKAKHEG